MKIAIIGSRTFNDYDNLVRYIAENINVFRIELVVSGGAKGTDKLGELFALHNNIPMKIYKPDWRKYGKIAGPIRNKQIVKEVDIVFAFWDCKSKGTKNAIGLAKTMKKKVHIFRYFEKDIAG